MHQATLPPWHKRDPSMGEEATPIQYLLKAEQPM
jgi:hypothetical protein